MNGEPVFTAVYLMLAGLVVGVLIAAPVGPVNVVCIQRTLERGFWAGFAAGLGAVLGDGLICTVAAFGITAISSTMAAHKLKINFIGAAVMIAFGLKLILMEPKVMATATTNMARLRRIVELIPDFLRPTLRLSVWRIMPHATVIPQTFFLTVTNLGAILGVFAIFGWIELVIGGIHQTTGHALVLVGSVMTGSILWWAGLASVIARIRHRLSHKRLRIINQVAGVILLVSGAALFVQFTASLIDHYRSVGAAPASRTIESPATPFQLPTSLTGLGR